MQTIIETTSGQTYQVRETNDAALAHVWFGIEVKRAKGTFVPKKNAREMLVRKAGSRIVAKGA